jgi:hypothetical protein
MDKTKKKERKRLVQIALLRNTLKRRPYRLFPLKMEDPQIQPYPGDDQIRFPPWPLTPPNLVSYSNVRLARPQASTS